MKWFFSLIARRPWLIAIFMFILVISAWTTFFVLSINVPMQKVDRDGQPIVKETPAETLEDQN